MIKVHITWVEQMCIFFPFLWATTMELNQSEGSVTFVMKPSFSISLISFDLRAKGFRLWPWAMIILHCLYLADSWIVPTDFSLSPEYNDSTHSVWLRWFLENQSSVNCSYGRTFIGDPVSSSNLMHLSSLTWMSSWNSPSLLFFDIAWNWRSSLTSFLLCKTSSQDLHAQHSRTKYPTYSYVVNSVRCKALSMLTPESDI